MVNYENELLNLNKELRSLDRYFKKLELFKIKNNDSLDFYQQSCLENHIKASKKYRASIIMRIEDFNNKLFIKTT